jgi:hypothetical protein
MSRKKIYPDGPEVERLRRVRAAIARKHKDFEGYCAYVESLYRGKKSSARATTRKAKPKNSTAAAKPSSRPSVRK